MLAQSHAPLSFLPYAFQSAVYLINRLPTPLLHHKSSSISVSFPPPLSSQAAQNVVQPCSIPCVSIVALPW